MMPVSGNYEQYLIFILGSLEVMPLTTDAGRAMSRTKMLIRSQESLPPFDNTNPKVPAQIIIF